MEKKSLFQKIQFDLIAIVAFLAITFMYLSPLLEGKHIQQSDIIQVNGISKETQDFHKKTGDYALWTNSLFGGMPTYMIWMEYSNNISTVFVNFFARNFPSPSGHVFLYFIGFYFLCRLLKLNVWLSMIGALAFGFSSYNFIILEAGHTNKALAIGYFAPLLAGVILLYRQKYFFGFLLSTLSLAIQIRTNHIQMTYYLGMSLIILGICYFIYSYKNGEIKLFIKSTSLLIASIVIALGINITNLWLTYEYGEETMRGKTELTLNKSANAKGLDKDYAYQYSYGISESFTLLVPNFMGGASQSDLGKNSEMYTTLKNNNIPNADQIVKQLPTYWGDQPFTSGPVYFGAIMIFLFFLSFFILEGPLKWWAAGSFIVCLLLSWGGNFTLISDLFFDYFPLYNKFRAVSSILVVPSLIVPFMAILAIKKISEKGILEEKLIRSLKISLYIFGGILFIFILMPGAFGSFTTEGDKQVFGQGYDSYISALISDRQSMLRSDAFRSLVFILLSTLAIFGFYKNKLKLNYFLAILGVLVIVDLWGVDKRYLNNEDFTSKNQSKIRYTPTNADLQILQDSSLSYRVVDFTTNPFTDSRTSYFHKNIGGYHAAKLKRYQEVIDNHLIKNNMKVYNMLNTKYYITQAGKEVQAQLNTNACGNSWFVNEVRFVANADSEMLALNTFDPLQTLIVDQRFKDQIGNIPSSKDSSDAIQLVSYSPNELVYKSNCVGERIAVFSEIYYAKGWDVFVDGKASHYFRANYLLRAMKVPSGLHTIEFKFEPKAYFLGQKIALVFSILFIALVGIYLLVKRKVFFS